MPNRPPVNSSPVCCDCYTVGGGTSCFDDPLQGLPYLRFCVFCIRQRPASLIITLTGFAAYIWLFVNFVIATILTTTNNDEEDNEENRNGEPLKLFENTTHWRIVYYPIQIFLMFVLLIAVIRVSKSFTFNAGFKKKSEK